MTVTPSDESETWLDQIFDAITSDMMACGDFDKVYCPEPKTGTPSGMFAALWAQRIEPVGMLSGLNVSSAVVVFMVRTYVAVVAEPADVIETNMMRAVSAMMRKWHDNYDFGLDPLVRNVDVLGTTNYRLNAEAGFIKMDDGKPYRCYSIELPVIVNDVWPQNKGV